jgi:hypothetical protein
VTSGLFQFLERASWLALIALLLWIAVLLVDAGLNA